MAEYKLPTLGETATQGIVAKVMVAPGEAVAQDQSVLELETDKAVLEVPSTVAGTVREVLVKQGDTVKVDQVIFLYESGGSGGAASTPASVNGTPGNSPSTNGSATNGSAANGAAPQATPQAPAPVAEVAPPEVTAGSAQAAGSGLGVSNVVATNGAAPQSTPVQDDGVAAAGAPPAQTAPAPSVPTPAIVRDPAAAAPSVRRLAREVGVDIHDVPGSGLGGRISEDDVKSFTRRKISGGAPASAGAAASNGSPAGVTAGPAAAPLPDFSKLGATERVPMTGIRKATSDQMMRAWTIPHVTQFDRADSTEFDAFRKKYAAISEKAGGKLTPTAILLKIVVGALKKFPNFNSSIDFATNEIVRKRFYNVGVAVDTPNGLVVPVIRNVDSKGIVQLAVELNELAARARDRKLKPEEMTGGTFTLTNLGGIGGTGFTPIVNTPEVAILGVARGSIEPVWNASKGEFEPRPLMPLCLSYDHRVIDGADGARFLRMIAGAIEDPYRIVLEG